MRINIHEEPDNGPKSIFSHAATAAVDFRGWRLRGDARPIEREETLLTAENL
jgi:hypothetical protein